ncbi:MAG: hypothetical protein JWP57_1828 [Spirosoma sp.]|nr:hypothetical protein [Spirosoma sp.]
MKNVFTFSRFAIVLLTVTCSTAPLLAQQRTTHHPTAAKRTTVAAKPRVTAAKPTVAAKPANVTTTSAPAQSKESLPKVQPVVASAQPVAVQPSQPGFRETTSRPARPARRAFAGSRNKYLNVGVGLASYYGGGLPLGASFEVDIKDNISVGGSVDYLRYSYGYNFIYFGARGSYHLGELLNVQDSKFDPYVGATLGFRHSGYANTYGYDYGAYNSGLFLGAHIGSRYYFGDKVGGFAEVGYGVSALRIGVTAKF